jgi:hypothetical protein
MRNRPINPWLVALGVAVLYFGSVFLMGALTSDVVRKGGGRPAIYFERNTFIASTSISESVAPTGTPFLLHEVRINHTVSAATGTLTVQLSSQAEITSGGLYDVILHTKDMASTVDHIWQPTRPLMFDTGDEIDITWSPDTATSGGLEALWEPL